MEIIKCHGSGNDFIMVDITREKLPQDYNWTAFTRAIADRCEGVGSDGVLLLVRHGDGVYGMDMLNPDGTHAEMCGNGIRCVTRLALERGYLTSGILRSGGRDYRVAAADPVADGIPAYSVDIPIRLHSNDFAFFDPSQRFVDEPIEELDSDLRFTALNLGNPHIVALVEEIDMELLEQLGSRVLKLKHLFPNGVNISLYKPLEGGGIFVATYERGAGITLSCGTAMTASATAAALLGVVDSGKRTEVRNRGGRVFCTTQLEPEIVTRLEGNATYEWIGEAKFENWHLECRVDRVTYEQVRWLEFIDSLNR